MSYNPNVPDFDNIAYDDLNKMRENFQILADIATRREDILSLAVEAGDILDSRIVEHNLNILSPTNGYYVRWENGFQLCWNRIDVDCNGRDTEGAWILPANFNTNLMTPFSWVAPNGSSPEGGIRRASYSFLTVYNIEGHRIPWVVTVLANATANDGLWENNNIFAIGRWK